MAVCAPDRDKAIAEARESFEWYPKTGARQIATLTDWMAERNQDLGTYSYAADMKKTDDEGLLDLLSLEYLMDANACVLGTPEECIEACRLYEEAGVDLLLCLVNPYKISHESVMQTIELMGTEVIPAFSPDPAPAGPTASGRLCGVGSARGRCWMVAAAVAVATVTVSATGSLLGGTGQRGPRAGRTERPRSWPRPGTSPSGSARRPTTELLVAVNTLTLHPGRSLDITFTVRNSAPTACSYTAPYAEAPGPHPDHPGGGAVRFRRLRDRRPAPAQRVARGQRSSTARRSASAQLAPGAIVTGTGLVEPDSGQRRRAGPVGSYTLVVDRRFTRSRLARACAH